MKNKQRILKLKILLFKNLKACLKANMKKKMKKFLKRIKLINGNKVFINKIYVCKFKG